MTKKMTKKDICNIISSDNQMMKILKIVKAQNLNDWWIGAGFVRNKVWNYLHHFKDEIVSDIDVIYFNKANINENAEKDIEKKLKDVVPNFPWSVKNQARMHLRNNEPEYKSSVDALSRWPETATSIAVTLSGDKVVLVAPHGIEDLINLKVTPTPAFMSKKEIYEKRQKEKNWQTKWFKLKIYHFK